VQLVQCARVLALRYCAQFGDVEIDLVRKQWEFHASFFSPDVYKQKQSQKRCKKKKE
jgi:hypothetical protein